MLSKYARKTALKKFAQNYTDQEWEKLCESQEFSEAVSGESMDLILAAELADKILKRKKPAAKPAALNSVAAALNQAQASPPA